jgi:hypothetical protein
MHVNATLRSGRSNDAAAERSPSIARLSAPPFVLPDCTIGRPFGDAGRVPLC